MSSSWKPTIELILGSTTFSHILIILLLLYKNEIYYETDVI